MRLPVQAALEKEAQDNAGAGKKKPPAVPRAAGGARWWDASLLEWPENDFRIFVGDLGNEVNDDVLTKSFQKYATFAKAKVVKDGRSNKSKGARAAGHHACCMRMLWLSCKAVERTSTEQACFMCRLWVCELH